MAKQKSDAKWLAIFKSFEESGLSVAHFCKQNGISSSTFYVKRSNLKKQTASSTSNFLPAHIVNDDVDLQNVPVNSSPAAIIIDVKHGSLSLPAETPASYVLEILKGLS